MPINAFPVRAAVCPCKRMRCSSLSSCSAPPPSPPYERWRREDHISQSQRCIGDIGMWWPAISHEHLPARPVPSTATISSPALCIDFKLTGVVMASVDVAACLPAPSCVIPSVCYGCHVCKAISRLVVSGQLLHPLLMELLTGDKLK